MLRYDPENPYILEDIERNFDAVAGVDGEVQLYADTKDGHDRYRAEW